MRVTKLLLLLLLLLLLPLPLPLLLLLRRRLLLLLLLLLLLPLLLLLLLLLPLLRTPWPAEDLLCRLSVLFCWASISFAIPVLHCTALASLASFESLLLSAPCCPLCGEFCALLPACLSSLPLCVTACLLFPLPY